MNLLNDNFGFVSVGVHKCESSSCPRPEFTAREWENDAVYEYGVSNHLGFRTVRKHGVCFDSDRDCVCADGFPTCGFCNRKAEYFTPSVVEFNTPSEYVDCKCCGESFLPVEGPSLFLDVYCGLCECGAKGCCSA